MTVDERKKKAGFPWHFWATFLLVGALVYATYQLFPPEFQISPVELTFERENCTVEFDVTNHAGTPATKTLKVTLFNDFPGNKMSGPHHTPLQHRNIAITVAPSETKHIRCEFPPAGATVPNQAEVKVTTDAL